MKVYMVGCLVMFELVGKLRCEICEESIKLNEYVVLNELNGVVHEKCYWKEKEKYRMKDSGTFKKILSKYFSKFE